VVQNERADVRVEGRIKIFKDDAAFSAGDDFPVVNTMKMVCTVDLWDPYDSDRIAPISRFEVPTQISYVSDVRNSIMETETDAKERLLRQMAKAVVQAVISGAPAPMTDLQTRGMQHYAERHNPQQYEPTVTEPRFVKPTPVPRETH